MERWGGPASLLIRWVFSVALLFPLGSAYSCRGFRGPEKDLRSPNILLIMADDLGYEGLSCNGSPRGIASRMGARVIQGGKGSTTDAGTHVPLIASWGGTPPRVLPVMT